MKKITLLTLGILALLSQIVTAELKLHSDSKSTYLDIINNTDYYVWLADVQQFNLPGKGTLETVWLVKKGWFGAYTEESKIFMRKSRTFSLDHPVVPGAKETVSWNDWGSGVTFIGNPSDGAKLKFNTDSNQPEQGTEYAFKLTPGLNQIFSVTIGGQEVKMNLQVTAPDRTEIQVGSSGRYKEPYNNYTITVTQTEPVPNKK